MDKYTTSSKLAEPLDKINIYGQTNSNTLAPRKKGIEIRVLNLSEQEIANLEYLETFFYFFANDCNPTLLDTDVISAALKIEYVVGVGYGLNKKNFPCFTIFMAEECQEVHQAKTLAAVANSISSKKGGKITMDECMRFMQIRSPVKLPSAANLTHGGEKFHSKGGSDSIGTLTCLLKAELKISTNHLQQPLITQPKIFAMTCAHCILPIYPETDPNFKRIEQNESNASARPSPTPPVNVVQESDIQDRSIIRNAREAPNFTVWKTYIHEHEPHFNPQCLFLANSPSSEHALIKSLQLYQLNEIDFKYFCSRFAITTSENPALVTRDVSLSEIFGSSDRYALYVLFTVDVGILEIVDMSKISHYGIQAPPPDDDFSNQLEPAGASSSSVILPNSSSSSMTSPNSSSSNTSPSSSSSSKGVQTVVDALLSSSSSSTTPYSQKLAEFAAFLKNTPSENPDVALERILHALENTPNENTDDAAALYHILRLLENISSGNSRKHIHRRIQQYQQKSTKYFNEQIADENIESLSQHFTSEIPDVKHDKAKSKLHKRSSLNAPSDNPANEFTESYIKQQKQFVSFEDAIRMGTVKNRILFNPMTKPFQRVTRVIRDGKIYKIFHKKAHFVSPKIQEKCVCVLIEDTKSYIQDIDEFFYKELKKVKDPSIVEAIAKIESGSAKLLKLVEDVTEQWQVNRTEVKAKEVLEEIEKARLNDLITDKNNNGKYKEIQILKKVAEKSTQKELATIKKRLRSLKKEAEAFLQSKKHKKEIKALSSSIARGENEEICERNTQSEHHNSLLSTSGKPLSHVPAKRHVAQPYLQPEQAAIHNEDGTVFSEVDEMVNLWSGLRQDNAELRLQVVTGSRNSPVEIPISGSQFYFEIAVQKHDSSGLYELPVILFDEGTENSSQNKLREGDSGSPLFLIREDDNDQCYFLGHICGHHEATRWDIGITSVAPKIFQALLLQQTIEFHSENGPLLDATSTALNDLEKDYIHQTATDIDRSSVWKRHAWANSGSLGGSIVEFELNITPYINHLHVD